MKRKMRIASLFCGAGGLDIGFHRAGFETVWANDFNGDACDTFRKWCPSATVVCGDIGKIDEFELPDDIDVMLGGFPCQGFSLSGPRKLDDKRNSLYRNYVRMVRAKMPKAFIGENVKGLLTMGGGQIVDAIIADFSDCGYEVRYKLLNAKDYGVPEDRQRVIIVGFRKNLGIDDFSYPAEHRHIVTLREVLGSVPEPSEGGRVARRIQQPIHVTQQEEGLGRRLVHDSRHGEAGSAAPELARYGENRQRPLEVRRWRRDETHELAGSRGNPDISARYGVLREPHEHLQANRERRPVQPRIRRRRLR